MTQDTASINDELRRNELRRIQELVRGAVTDMDDLRRLMTTENDEIRRRIANMELRLTALENELRQLYERS